MKKIILSVALLATGFTCSYATSVADMTKDALINKTDFKVAGTFGTYDFAPKGDKDKFDWAFTTITGSVFQLRGKTPSDTDVFGWAPAPAGTVAPIPAWYMFQVDVDGDGMGKFDWVLLSANGNSVYKLDGVADDGGFAYAGPIDIDYKIDGSSITTGAKGTLDESTEPEPQPVEDDPNKLHVTDASDLYGYTIEATHISSDSRYNFTIECSGKFKMTYSTNGKVINPLTITGTDISIDSSPTNGGGISFVGVNFIDETSDSYIGFKNQTSDIVVDQSTPDGLLEWFVTSITKDSTCASN